MSKLIPIRKIRVKNILAPIALLAMKKAGGVTTAPATMNGNANQLSGLDAVRAVNAPGSVNRKPVFGKHKSIHCGILAILAILAILVVPSVCAAAVEPLVKSGEVAAKVFGSEEANGKTEAEATPKDSISEEDAEIGDVHKKRSAAVVLMAFSCGAFIGFIVGSSRSVDVTIYHKNR